MVDKGLTDVRRITNKRQRKGKIMIDEDVVRKETENGPNKEQIVNYDSWLLDKQKATK